ncbi:citrate lyase acyl carrier protein, partial [bacterium]|nr:citrate lyase acyl carrier protein [bacterium]
TGVNHMKISKKSSAGSLESSDLMVYLEPMDTIKVEAVSSVSTSQHQKEIEALVKKELKKAGITGAYVKVQDNGALNLTIKARLKTAISRGIE